MAFFDTGERIRELRQSAGLSQEQLAELSSLNRVTIAKYEAGRVEPGAQALSRIADAPDVSAAILLGKAQASEESSGRPKTNESRIISSHVDKMTKEDRARALAMMEAVFADYFEKEKDKMA